MPARRTAKPSLTTHKVIQGWALLSILALLGGLCIYLAIDLARLSVHVEGLAAVNADRMKYMSARLDDLSAALSTHPSEILTEVQNNQTLMKGNQERLEANQNEMLLNQDRIIEILSKLVGSKTK